jgi:protein-disulfide isomerase
MPNLDKLANTAIIAAAICISGSMLFKRVPDDGIPVAEPPMFLSDWAAVADDGIGIGPADAPIHILEFADLECPYCARWHLTVLPALEREFPGKIRVTVVHYPLPTHRFAVAAANAAECAAAQDRGPEFIRAVYVKQDSIGLRPWEQYAADATLSIAEFSACMSSSGSKRIEAGRKWANKYGVRGTPNLIFNGWQYQMPPGPDQARLIAQEILRGKNPS